MRARFRKPCLDCGVVTDGPSRCPACSVAYARRVDAMRDKTKRALYSGSYRARAKRVRDSAEHCWICGGGVDPSDPWQADHVTPDDPLSPLLAAHRSCNIRRALQFRNQSKEVEGHNPGVD
jgi:5-methylcytosine-specific restriction protein A